MSSQKQTNKPMRIVNRPFVSLKGKWLSWCLVSSALGFPTLASAQDDTVYWPRLDLVIPFQVESNGRQPREVILEMSDNQGRQWKVHDRGNVRTRQFQFVAPSDGLYLFRLKTVDEEGRRYDNPGEPLKILVDTEKPLAKLVVDINKQGMMEAEFLVSDPCLDEDSLQLQYQTEGTSPQWVDVPFEIEKSTNPGELTGFGQWNLPNSARQLIVRIKAKDKAGNETEFSKFPQLPKTATGPRAVQLASQPRSMNSAPVIGSGLPQISDLPRVDVLGQPHEPSGKIDPDAAKKRLIEEYELIIEKQQKLLDHKRNVEQQQRLELESGLTLTPESRTIPESGTPLAIKSSTPVPVMSESKAPRSFVQNVPSNFPVRELSDKEIEAARNGESILFTGAKGEQSLLLPESSDTSTSLPSTLPSSLPTGDQLNSFTLPKPDLQTNLGPIPKSTNPNAKESFSRKVQPTFSHSRTFHLDYHVENDPGAPIAEIELWGTSDQGQTWEPWGQDPDRKSPFDIEVETDGLFGYRMVIIGANGLASNRPRNGDNADAWIHVDTEKPIAKITSALYGNGRESGALVIDYQAKDDYFTERPISLFYSETREGPWQAISRGVRNQGRFVWPSDPNLPPSVFLRIDATDAAGNVATSILDVPVNIEGIAPRGRIQGLRPIPRGKQ